MCTGCLSHARTVASCGGARSSLASLPVARDAPVFPPFSLHTLLSFSLSLSLVLFRTRVLLLHTHPPVPSPLFPPPPFSPTVVCVSFFPPRGGRARESMCVCECERIAITLRGTRGKSSHVWCVCGVAGGREWRLARRRWRTCSSALEVCTVHVLLLRRCVAGGLQRGERASLHLCVPPACGGRRNC